VTAVQTSVQEVYKAFKGGPNYKMPEPDEFKAYMLAPIVSDYSYDTVPEKAGQPAPIWFYKDKVGKDGWSRRVNLEDCSDCTYKPGDPGFMDLKEKLAAGEIPTSKASQDCWDLDHTAFKADDEKYRSKPIEISGPGFVQVQEYRQGDPATKEPLSRSHNLAVNTWGPIRCPGTNVDKPYNDPAAPPSISFGLRSRKEALRDKDEEKPNGKFYMTTYHCRESAKNCLLEFDKYGGAIRAQCWSFKNTASVKTSLADVDGQNGTHDHPLLPGRPEFGDGGIEVMSGTPGDSGLYDSYLRFLVWPLSSQATDYNPDLANQDIIVHKLEKDGADNEVSRLSILGTSKDLTQPKLLKTWSSATFGREMAPCLPLTGFVKPYMWCHNFTLVRSWRVLVARCNLVAEGGQNKIVTKLRTYGIGANKDIAVETWRDTIPLTEPWQGDRRAIQVLVGNIRSVGSQDILILASASTKVKTSIIHPLLTSDGRFEILQRDEIALEKSPFEDSKYIFQRFFFTALMPHELPAAGKTRGQNVLQVSIYNDSTKPGDNKKAGAMFLCFRTFVRPDYIEKNKDDKYTLGETQSMRIPFKGYYDKPVEDKLWSKPHFVDRGWHMVSTVDQNKTPCTGVLNFFSYYGVLGARVFSPTVRGDYRTWALTGQAPFLGQSSRSKWSPPIRNNYVSPRLKSHSAILLFQVAGVLTFSQASETELKTDLGRYAETFLQYPLPTFNACANMACSAICLGAQRLDFQILITGTRLLEVGAWRIRIRIIVYVTAGKFRLRSDRVSVHNHHNTTLLRGR
jgi:hypothetical protein